MVPSHACSWQGSSGVGAATLALALALSLALSLSLSSCLSLAKTLAPGLAHLDLEVDLGTLAAPNPRLLCGEGSLRPLAHQVLEARLELIRVPERRKGEGGGKRGWSLGCVGGGGRMTGDGG